MPMKVLKGLLLFIVLAVAGVVVAGFLLPDRAHLERSTVIDAPPATVYTVLNGFRQFNRWSPWAQLDPNTAYTYEGPAAGVGAVYRWSSADPSVGSGSQEILESTPYSEIQLRLVFGDFKSENTVGYRLTPEGAGTRLVWSYDSEFGGDIVGRWFGLMLDGMLGPDYEKGLAQLKAFCEGLPKTDFSGLAVELMDAQARPIAYLAGSSRTDAAAIGKAYAVAYGKIMQVLESARVQQTGPVLAIGRKWDEQAGVYEFDAAIPVPADAALPTGAVKLGTTYAGPALKAVHRGPYEGLGAHFEKLMAYKAAAGYTDNGNSWDVYVSDPAKTPAAELITESYVPVK